MGDLLGLNHCKFGIKPTVGYYFTKNVKNIGTNIIPDPGTCRSVRNSMFTILA